jgi:thiol-disulfide isomerase/thioredoxin
MRSSILVPILALVATTLVGCDSKREGAIASASAEPTNAPVTKDGFVVLDVAPTANGDVKSAVRAEVAKAKAQGLTPFVEFAAGWCPPCQAIKKSLDDPQMKAAFKGTYIIRLDADAWGEHLAGSGFSPRSIPVFYQLDGDGKPTGKTIDGSAWADNIPVNMAPPLDKFFHGT